MQTNKLDKSIKEKLAGRTFKPSAAAWEHLSKQLENQPKKNKRGWFFYTGAAASILLLISVGFIYFNNAPSKAIEKIVINPIDTTNIINKKKKLLINSTIKEEVIVKVEKVEEKIISQKVLNSYSDTKRDEIVTKNIRKEKDIIIAKVDEKEKVNNKSTSENNALQQVSKSRIKINPDDLLYAVTHSAEEVNSYYAKYNVKREDVLRTIKNELKKSNIKVNPNTILAEVERTIDDDDFQNNFMKSLKKKISDFASVIASRND